MPCAGHLQHALLVVSAICIALPLRWLHISEERKVLVRIYQVQQTRVQLRMSFHSGLHCGLQETNYCPLAIIGGAEARCFRWSLVNIYVLLCCVSCLPAVVVSPGGTLEAWSLSA